MTTNSTTAKDRLAKFGIHLPDAATPFGAEEVPTARTSHLGEADTSEILAHLGASRASMR